MHKKKTGKRRRRRSQPRYNRHRPIRAHTLKHRLSQSFPIFYNTFKYVLFTIRRFFFFCFKIAPQFPSNIFIYRHFVAGGDWGTIDRFALVCYINITAVRHSWQAMWESLSSLQHSDIHFWEQRIHPTRPTEGVVISTVRTNEMADRFCQIGKRIVQAAGTHVDLTQLIRIRTCDLPVLKSTI